MKKCLVVVVMLFLQSCGFTSEGTAIRTAIVEGGTKITTQLLKDSEWIVCEATPIGLLRQKYKGREKEYNSFCSSGGLSLKGETAPSPLSPQ